MTSATWKKLERLGYDEKFIANICHFRKNHRKRYEMRVTDANEKGEIFICHACFNTEEELKEIIKLLTYFDYVMIDKKEGKEIGRGWINEDCLKIISKYETNLLVNEAIPVLTKMLIENQVLAKEAWSNKNFGKARECFHKKEALQMAIDRLSEER